MNSSRWRNLGIAGVACLVVIGLIAEALRPKRVSGAGTGTPPDVMVAQVEQRDVPIYGEWIGTLDGFVNADVRAHKGEYLGELGGRIVAEVIVELLRNDRTSLLSESDWQPDLAGADGRFGIADLLRYAGVV
jgi:hypothetical protein